MNKAKVFLLVIGLLVLAGCTPEANEPADDPPPADDAAEEEAPPSEESPADVLNAMDEWDIIWLSDSSGWDVAAVYAAMVEEDTGKTVNLIDWSGNGSRAVEVLNALEGDLGYNRTLETLPDQIAEAEIVVFYANPEESVDESRPWDFNCGQGPGETFVNVCDMESFAVYIQNLEAIYAYIFELRGDQPIIIRAYDAYNARVNRWREDDTFDICQECWGNYNAAIHQAAATYNIPVAGVAEAWNGPNRDTDPNDLGYTRDGEHPNEAGAQAIAEAIRVLGYEPVIAP